MSDDMFANLQPATVSEAMGAKDETAKAAIKKQVADEAKATIPQTRTREKKLLVIDPSKLENVPEPLREAVVGTIAIPEEFCGLDSIGCSAQSESRHMFSFTKEHGWWVHMSCGQPTRKWYTGAFLDLVEADDQELSFLDE